MTKSLKWLKSQIVFTILVMLCIVLASCEAEHYLVEKEPVAISVSDVKIRTMPYQEAGGRFREMSNKLQLDRHLGLTKSDGMQSREMTGDGIEIVDGLVKEITYGEYTSYTMLIKSDEATDKFYNLVIEDIGQLTKMFIAKYEPTPEWQLNKGAFEGVVTTYKINDLQTPLDQIDFPTHGESPTGGSTNYPTDCNGIVNTTIVVEPIMCSEHVHWPWSTGPCNADVPARIETTYYYECVVSNPNPFDGAPGGTPGTSNPSTGPGGGSGGSSTSNGTNPSPNTSLTAPIDPRECIERIVGDLNHDCILSPYETCLLEGNSQEVCECVQQNGSFEECQEFIEITAEVPDAKYERYSELMQLIENNPWALIENCALQNGLNTANYQNLFNHTIPQSCKTRLNNLGSGWSNQPLNTGNAAVANVDYYGVQITTRPDINNDGLPDSNSEIFNAYKQNFADLASGQKNNFQFSCDIPIIGNTTDVGWGFYLYFNSDWGLWLNNNPVTTIFKIDAWAEGFPFGLIADDGAIMISKYTPNYWIGSTIQTPDTGTQPFSGNREWGWLINQNGNLELYARAVDVARISDVINKLPPYLNNNDCQEDTYYNIGEATWSNLQQEIKQFIIDNGGQAKIIPKTVIRFNKTKLKEMLESNESIEQITCN